MQGRRNFCLFGLFYMRVSIRRICAHLGGGAEWQSEWDSTLAAAKKKT